MHLDLMSTWDLLDILGSWHLWRHEQQYLLALEHAGVSDCR